MPIRPLNDLVRLVILNPPGAFSTDRGASKRSKSFNSIELTVKLRIVKGGRAIVSLEDEEDRPLTFGRRSFGVEHVVEEILGIL